MRANSRTTLLAKSQTVAGMEKRRRKDGPKLNYHTSKKSVSPQSLVLKRILTGKSGKRLLVLPTTAARTTLTLC